MTHLNALPHPALSPADTRLLQATAGQAGISLACAGAALAADLPAECLLYGPTHAVWQEFLLPQGWGTAMSPPRSVILLSLTVAALLRLNAGPRPLWRGALCVTGLLFTAGQFAEPYTRVALLDVRGHDHLHQLLMVTFIGGVTSLFVLGVQALFARRP